MQAVGQCRTSIPQPVTMKLPGLMSKILASSCQVFEKNGGDLAAAGSTLEGEGGGARENCGRQ